MFNDKPYPTDKSAVEVERYVFNAIRIRQHYLLSYFCLASDCFEYASQQLLEVQALLREAAAAQDHWSDSRTLLQSISEWVHDSFSTGCFPVSDFKLTLFLQQSRERLV